MAFFAGRAVPDRYPILGPYLSAVPPHVWPCSHRTVAVRCVTPGFSAARPGCARPPPAPVCFNTVMSTSGHLTYTEAAIGDVVQVRREGGHVVAGTLVEDFVDFLLTADALGRSWGTPRRWAVALTGGTLMFADDADIITVRREQSGA